MNRITHFFSRVFQGVASKFSSSNRSSETTTIAQRSLSKESPNDRPSLTGRAHSIETDSSTPRNSNTSDKILILQEASNSDILLELNDLRILVAMSKEELQTEGLPKKIQDLFLSISEENLNSSHYRKCIREILIKSPAILNLAITKKLIQDPNYHKILLTAVLTQIDKEGNADFLKENYPVISLLTTDHLDPNHPLFGETNRENLIAIQELETEKPESKSCHTKLTSFYLSKLQSSK